MRACEKDHAMNIFIIGSKPSPIFPDVKPDVVYAANGALTHVQASFETAKIYSVLSDYVLFGDTPACEGARTVLKGARCYELILSLSHWHNPAPKDVAEISPVTFDHLTKIRHFEKTTRIIKALKRDVLCSQITRLFKQHPLRFLYLALFKQQIDGLKLSTGALALSQAMRMYPDAEKYYMIGIGLDVAAAHFYNKGKIYGAQHVLADRLYYQAILSEYGTNKFLFTDPDVKSLLQTE